MKKNAGIFISIVVLLLISTNTTFAWNEEQTDSLGQVKTFHSVRDYHSTFHYDLTLLLAVKMGFSPDTAELMARYCALVDQINPKPGYPYPLALNNISIPDTIPTWDESLAGTERGNIFSSNGFEEKAPQYWHFPIKAPNDTISGGMVYGNYPQVYNPQYRNSPYFWRVPLLPSLQNMLGWGVYGTGEPGNPEQAPAIVQYYNKEQNQYVAVEPGSLIAFAIYLHALADAYSHEHCMVEDTLRSHPPVHDFCGLNYHSHYEFAYDQAIVAEPHAVPAIQAVWRALREYKRMNGPDKPAFWTDDSNGFQDGDGIPDELENDGDADYSESFAEKWISPAPDDLNGDGIINNHDHTTWRILVCNNDYCDVHLSLEPAAILDVGEVFQANPSVDYYDTLYWTTSGDGYFENPTDLFAKYHYGVNDSINGNVNLTLHIINFRGCSDELTAVTTLYLMKKQILTLPAGWSGISSNLLLVSTSIDSILQAVAQDIVILQNLTGFYLPGQSGTTLTEWSRQSGYQIKTHQPVQLAFAGHVLNENTITIEPGWNLIPVLADCDQPVEQLFADNLEKVVIIKESPGLKIAWPEAGIETLEFLSPGKSYLIFANGAFDLQFTNCNE